MTRGRRSTVSLLLYVAVASATAVSKSDPLPTPFPDSFLIPFRTNVTSTHHINNTMSTNADTNVGGMLYYDWTIQRQRVDYAAGSYECLHFYQTQESCTLILYIRHKECIEFRLKTLLPGPCHSRATTARLGIHSKPYIQWSCRP